MGAGRVGDLHGAHGVVAGYHLPAQPAVRDNKWGSSLSYALVSVLDGRGVGVGECSINESVHQTCLSHTCVK